MTLPDLLRASATVIAMFSGLLTLIFLSGFMIGIFTRNGRDPITTAMGGMLNLRQIGTSEFWVNRVTGRKFHITEVFAIYWLIPCAPIIVGVCSVVYPLVMISLGSAYVLWWVVRRTRK